MKRVPSTATSNDYFMKFKDKRIFEQTNSVKSCFEYFDSDRDGNLNEQEFEALLKCLYSFNGNPYFISSYNFNRIFKFYDRSKKSLIDFGDFEIFWNTAVQSTLLSRKALIIVDVQKDFIDGTLALRNCPAKEEASEVVPIINELITQVPFDVIVYTQDWHPADHVSFYENLNLRKLNKQSSMQSVDNIRAYDTVVFDRNNGTDDGIEQKLWPLHCVENTDGADFDSNLIVLEESERVIVVKKGTHSDVDSYSAFFDNSKESKTNLDDELKKRNIDEIYVCGVATDVCVAATSNDGIDLGYKVILVENASRGVNSDEISNAKKRLISRGALVVDSKQLYKMIIGEDRRPELLYPLLKDS